MHTHLSRRAGGVVAVALALCAPLAHAIDPGLVAETGALEWVTGTAGDTDFDTDTTVPGPAQALAFASLPEGMSDTTSVASADFGLVEVATQSMGFYSAGVGQLVNAQSLSTASFRDDTVTINAPGFGPGDFDSFVARFELNHEVNMSAIVLNNLGGRVDIVGGYELNVQLNNTTPGPYAGLWAKSTNGTVVVPTPPEGDIEVVVPFEYGVPFTIAAELEINLLVTSLNGINSIVNAEMNLGSAFFWKGVDPASLPEDASIGSANVGDWSKPFPENVPAPGAFTLLSLAAAPLCRRRRR